jgi:hypothetical protein
MTPRRALSRLCYACVCGTIMMVLACAASAQDPLLEYAVKATYLNKFAPFVDWPKPEAEFPGGSFTVCIVGDDPLDGLLDRAVTGQDVAGHPIVVRRFAAVTDNPGCTVVYVTGPPGQVAADLAALRGMPVLTVTDGAADAAARGIINFVIVDNRVRFEIDDSTAVADGLTISSKLLSLAVRVEGRRR